MHKWLVGILPLMAGCAGTIDPDGTLVVFFADLGLFSGTTTATCGENLVDADCPASEDDTDPGDWTSTSTSEGTGGQAFAEFVWGDKLDDGRRRGVMTKNGHTFQATVDKDGGQWLIDAERVAEDRVTETQTHTPTGFTFSETDDEIMRVVYALALDPGTGDVTGTRTLEYERTFSQSETDAYDGSQVFSQWNPYNHLDCSGGDCTNYPAAGDCESEPCTFTVTTVSTQTADVWGWVIHTEDFDDIQDAGQPEGGAAW